MTETVSVKCLFDQDFKTKKSTRGIYCLSSNKVLVMGNAKRNLDIGTWDNWKPENQAIQYLIIKVT